MTEPTNRVAELERQVAALRGALEPVAQFVAALDRNNIGDTCPITIAPERLSDGLCAGDLRKLAALASSSPAEGHVYTSTACQHGLHDRCRRECKYCQAACNCPCGHTSSGPAVTEKHPDSVRLTEAQSRVVTAAEHWYEQRDLVAYQHGLKKLRAEIERFRNERALIATAIPATPEGERSGDGVVPRRVREQERITGRIILGRCIGFIRSAVPDFCDRCGMHYELHSDLAAHTEQEGRDA